MQSNSIWKYRGLLVKSFPSTPYIDTVYNLWCGRMFRVYNDPNIHWTADEWLYPHVSEYGYNVLAEETPNVQWQSVQRGYFGEDANIEDVVEYFNQHRFDTYDGGE